MSIINNLRRSGVAVYEDKLQGGDLATRIGTAAMDAMMKGINSTEWKRYMALFCDTKDELAQLTLERPTDGTYMRQMRAYIVANAVCTGATGTETQIHVSKNIEPGGVAAPAGTDDPATLRQQLGFSIP